MFIYFIFIVVRGFMVFSPTLSFHFYSSPTVSAQLPSLKGLQPTHSYEVTHMKLDLIVPHYKEPWNVCKYLFDSIALQRGVPMSDIRVIVVNDGDDTHLDDVDFYTTYPYEVVYLKKEHEGVSAARNYGLDYSDADYVMFCDIDDGFLNNYGLHLVFSAMNEGADLIHSTFIEETFDTDGNPALYPHKNDFTFMHGKAYKREFMLKYNLRFNNGLTIHEDGYFNGVVLAAAKHEGVIRAIENPIYLWCWNDNSTVRRNREDFVLKTYEELMQTRTETSRQLKARGYEEDFRVSVAMTVLNSYYDFQKTAYYLPRNGKHLVKALRAFKRYWNEFKDVFADMNNNEVADLSITARQNALRNGMLMERQTLKEFTKYIEREVK